jgi:TetR/AcrR family transcriptional regulator
MVRITAEARQETRLRLLEAAAKEFARVGLARANINEISVAAGLAKGTMYNYFDSKDELFLAVVEEACQRAVAGAEARPGAGTREQLEAVLLADMRWVRENESFAQVLVREVLTGDHKLHRRVLAAAAPFLSRVADILRDGVEQGEVRRDLPVDQLALVFTGLSELLLLQHWGSDGGWPPLDQIPELAVQFFLDGATPSRARSSPATGRTRRKG